MSDREDEWRWADVDPFEKLAWPGSGPVAAGEPGLCEPQPQASRSDAPKPSFAAPFIEDGSALFEQFRFEEAVGSYSAAVEAEPDHPTAHFDLAVCLEKTEQWAAAASSFRRALELDPGRSDALVGLGACLLHLDRIEEALGCFEQRIEQRIEQRLKAGDECEPALLGKAVALQKLARFQEAARIYNRLLRINPKAAEPLTNLIALSVARQDDAAVFEYSQRLLRVNPQSEPALRGLALLAVRKGDRTAAAEFRIRLAGVAQEDRIA